jgi:hypothetical protein
MMHLFVRLGMLVALSVMTACAPADAPAQRLPLVEDKPTFLWFFTNP